VPLVDKANLSRSDVHRVYQFYLANRRCHAAVTESVEAAFGVRIGMKHMHPASF